MKNENAHALMYIVKLDELKKEHLKLKKELALWTINKNRTYDNDFLHHDDIVYNYLFVQCDVTDTLFMVVLLNSSFN